jgi:uncharacterized protein YciI
VTSVKAQRVVVRFAAGPTWQSGSVTEQPGWDEHAAFVDALIERGIFVMGGPFADGSGTLVILEQVDEAGAVTVLAGDPFLANGVFVLEDVRAWDVFVDELRKED